MLKKTKLGVAITLAATLSASVAFAENIKIAFVDPLSGPFATTGTNGAAEWTYAADVLVNDKGGVLGGKNFEIVTFDNKMSGKESLIQVQVAIDQGIRFIAQGNSSGIAAAITDAVNKHNRRNPDDRVLFINYSAVDPALTNEKCNFWHFRFDANADIKMDALTDVMAARDDLKKVYLIGQDYSFGKAVAAAAERDITNKRPDVEIVGNELHPIGKVKDFTPYARKIVASGADSVITGNWGSDMVGLGKAIIEAGFEGQIYTYYAASNGITRTFGEDGKGHLNLVHEGQLNPPVSDRASAYVDGFEAKYPDHDISQARIANAVEMLAKAIDAAGTADDVVKVAYALEGMEHDSIWGGKVFMRPQDHQAIQDVHVGAHTDENIRHPLDNSPYGLMDNVKVEMAAMDSATTCEMKRP
ncbi:MAG TPA: branched-chain amino acid ABC transporter substrate-binding protein [Rhodobacteraceae bacterium]|jgi:branched-chain amino acid transport system substrate-binding protein|nr:branched-chain amino acid ABC transporter substrate-binding protein [Amylibacter sp.]MDG2000099.1 branched-chain amino acid ABC transporter substrate-binding protein [Amylibacter sp.]HAD27583.1 branched-chain amino acid ABC transporter substrate-binding protein [Paracoccaceae bacterium]